MANDDPVPVRREGFIIEELDGETLLFNEITKRTLYLNESATAIWKLCDDKRTPAEIAEILKEAYPEASEDFEADVRATLGQLASEGALRWQPVKELPG